VQQTWPEVVNKVDQQTFDVRSIVILVCHDHNRSVSQTFSVVILLADLKTHNLSEICDLFIVLDLLHVSLSYVQKFSAQGETSVEISSNYFNPC
jgi:hypothetical protein